MLALKSQAPVLPAYLDGTQRGLEMAQGVFYAVSERYLRFGQPLHFSRDKHRHASIERSPTRSENAVRSLQILIRSEAATNIYADL